MRKIDKSEILALSFQEDLEEHSQKNNGIHPKYESGKWYHKEVFFNLLYNQKGVCAYTEFLIFDKYAEIPSYFENGRLKTGISKDGIFGEVEHFDPSLKTLAGWSYDNLFIEVEHINRRKRDKPVHSFFKPDAYGYNPNLYLEYNFETHRFIPLDSLENDIKSKTDEMIDIVGINTQTIIDQRKSFLNRIKTDIKTGIKTFEYIRHNEVYQFFTAFEMSEEDFHS
ncbi:MAG: hypothetical protein ACKVOU_15365 [Cytophagales bacterium]